MFCIQIGYVLHFGNVLVICYVCMLLVHNIGMKSDKEVTAKDIVSSIICAANRKMQKAKARKSTSSPGEDNTDHHGEVKQVSVQKCYKNLLIHNFVFQNSLKSRKEIVIMINIIDTHFESI